MREPENEQANKRELAALFAAAEAAPPESDPRFVAAVIRRIRRRERMRLWVLGGSALIASVFGLPALWELLAAWNGLDPNLLDELNVRLYQGLSAITDLLRAAGRSITFLTAAALAITIVPLLRWLAD